MHLPPLTLVEILHSTLQMGVTDANAMRDALTRIMSWRQDDITAVYDKVQTSIRTNTDELIRLGVVYKTTDGKLEQTSVVVANAKNVLDQYTEGWDRNQAAVAMGMGSYAQISNYLKVNQTELDKSKSRLNDYNLAIGPVSKQYLADYQRAMREFNNELTLMGGCGQKDVGRPGHARLYHLGQRF